MSPAPCGSLLLQRIKLGHALEIRNGIPVIFSPRLPHLLSCCLVTKTRIASVRISGGNNGGGLVGQLLYYYEKHANSRHGYYSSSVIKYAPISYHIQPCYPLCKLDEFILGVHPKNGHTCTLYHIYSNTDHICAQHT